MTEIFKVLSRSRVAVTALITISIIAFLVTLFSVEFRADDPWFAKYVVEYDLVSWLAYRWNEWSSRIVPEALLWFFAPRPMLLWVVCSLVVYGLFMFFLWKHFSIVASKPSKRKTISAVVLIVSAVWLLSSGVADEAIFWLTGSVNYFWMSLLFLVASYTPLYILLKRESPKKLYIWCSAIAAPLLAVSHEQFGMALVGLLGIVSVLCFTSRPLKGDKYLHYYILGLLIVSLGAFTVSMSAPGVAARSVQETATWLPDMHTISLAVRGESDIRWFMDKMINATGYLLVVLWAVMGGALRKKNKYIAYSLMGLAFLLFVIKLSATGVAFGTFLYASGLIQLVDFHAEWGFVGGIRSWIPVIFWMGALLITLIAPLLIYKGKNNQRGILLVSLFVVAAGTLAALWLSPTMYASGLRVAFVASLLLILALVLLLGDHESKGADYSLVP